MQSKHSSPASSLNESLTTSASKTLADPSSSPSSSFTSKETMKPESPSTLGQDEGYDSPFAFALPILSDLIDPKNLDLLKLLGGPEGILKGLQTNPSTGLNSNESKLNPIKIEEITNQYDEHMIQEILKKKDYSTNKEDKDKEDKDKDKIKSKPFVMPIPDENAPFYQRLRSFGANVLPERKPKSIFELMWIAMQEKVLILLTIAAIVSLGLGLYEDFGIDKDKHETKIRWIEGVAIIVAILIVVLVGSLNDWQKERQFQKLNAKKEDRDVKIIRDGKESLISVHDVLVGDILKLEPGDIIPCDGIILEAHNLKCDESTATGESDTIKKLKYEECIKGLESNTLKADPFIISGSKVLEGVGSYVVIAVGVNSFNGKTMMGAFFPLLSRLRVFIFIHMVFCASSYYYLLI